MIESEFSKVQDEFQNESNDIDSQEELILMDCINFQSENVSVDTYRQPAVTNQLSSSY